MAIGGICLYATQVIFGSAVAVEAADLAEAQRLADAGEYKQALQEATTALEGNIYYDRWHLLKGEMELTLGRWRDARSTIDEGLTRHRSSIRLRWLARDVYRRNDDAKSAERMLTEILDFTRRAPLRYSDAENLVVLGQVALEVGIDPKEVLKSFFERAQQSGNFSKAPPLAIGQLALDKHDFKLATTTFRNALERFPNDADLLFGLAVALQESDRTESAERLEQALAANPRHIPSLLLIADRQIDAEEYDDAHGTLEQVLAINPLHDEAHAYLAAIAHLQNDPEEEQSQREAALSSWSNNPRVDFLIGRELSQKYRFEEGLAAQRKAIALDPKSLPSRRQAAEDLMRLGQVEEGWELAAAVFDDNQYDVAAYNLITLKDAMQKFAVLKDESFVLRMDAHEADVYGWRAMELLNRAKTRLCDKYGLDLTDKVAVEIFPDPADFEVRTLGMPGIPGFLGVCFGKVITANSPASQAGNPSNWESVLWHEFCHVVTLQLTRNRMPRWLSEGISVYEERLEDPRWGQPMTPADRQRILDGDLTPIHDLSSAFTDPDAPGGIAFAYFQSSLVVEFLVETYGFDALLSVMQDLANGLPINEAIPRNTVDMPQLEDEFVAFARNRAESLAPEVDWSDPELGGLIADDNSESLLRSWVAAHPSNWKGLMTFADVLIENENWPEARRTLERMHELYPRAKGGESPLIKLASIARSTGDVETERAMLERYAEVDAAAPDVFLKLIAMAEAAEDWQALERNALRLMGVNPLTKHPHEALATAAEQNGSPQLAIGAYRALLSLSPADPSRIHFRLAEQLAIVGDERTAKRHVLQSLESAPRYRDAQRLLLKLIQTEKE